MHRILMIFRNVLFIVIYLMPFSTFIEHYLYAATEALTDMELCYSQ